MRWWSDYRRTLIDGKHSWSSVSLSQLHDVCERSQTQWSSISHLAVTWRVDVPESHVTSLIHHVAGCRLFSLTLAPPSPAQRALSLQFSVRNKISKVITFPFIPLWLPPFPDYYCHCVIIRSLITKLIRSFVNIYPQCSWIVIGSTLCPVLEYYQKRDAIIECAGYSVMLTDRLKPTVRKYFYRHEILKWTIGWDIFTFSSKIWRIWPGRWRPRCLLRLGQKVSRELRRHSQVRSELINKTLF